MECEIEVKVICILSVAVELNTPSTLAPRKEPGHL